MSYYQGDFYRGDFYRGDPGIGSFFAGLAKKAVGFIPGVGPAISGVLEAVTKTGAAKTAGGIVKRAGGAIVKHPVLSAAAAVGAAGAMGAGAERMAMGRGMGRKCRHINPHTGKCIRRMRVTNPKALRRAIRRTTGFAKLAMRTIHLVHPKKKVRFGGFRRRRTRN